MIIVISMIFTIAMMQLITKLIVSIISLCIESPPLIRNGKLQLFFSYPLKLLTYT